MILGLDWLPDLIILGDSYPHSPITESLRSRIYAKSLNDTEQAVVWHWCKRHLAEIRDADAFVRAFHLSLASERSHEADALAVPVVLEGLASADEPTRRGAARAAHELARWGFDESRSTAIHEHRAALIQAMERGDEQPATAAALYARGGGGDMDEVVPVLVSLLSSGPVGARAEAADSLAFLSLRSASAASALRAVCRDSPEDSRKAAFRAAGLWRSGDKELVELMRQGLRDPSDDVAGEAAIALIDVAPTPENVQAVASAFLAGREHPVGFVTALYRGHFREAKIVPAVIAALRADPDTLAPWAGPYLSDLGALAQSAIPALDELMAKPDLGIRAQAYLTGVARGIRQASFTVSPPP